MLHLLLATESFFERDELAFFIDYSSAEFISSHNQKVNQKVIIR